MTGFQEVKLSWDGEDYTIAPSEQMGLVHILESTLSGSTGRQAIGVLLAPEGPPYGILAAAFGAMLRYAGAKVADEDIYLSMMDDMANSKADLIVKTQGAVVAVLSVIAPPIGLKMGAVSEGGGKK